MILFYLIVHKILRKCLPGKYRSARVWYQVFTSVHLGIVVCACYLQKKLTEDVVDDVRLVVQDLVDDHAEDAHLRSTAVVELNRALFELGLLVEVLPLLLEGVNARHVAGEGALLLLHDEDLKEADEDDDLSDAEAAHLQKQKSHRNK